MYAPGSRHPVPAVKGRGTKKAVRQCRRGLRGAAPLRVMKNAAGRRERFAPTTRPAAGSCDGGGGAKEGARDHRHLRRICHKPADGAGAARDTDDARVLPEVVHQAACGKMEEARSCTAGRGAAFCMILFLAPPSMHDMRAAERARNKPGEGNAEGPGILGRPGGCL